jgi:predicted transposase YbfD/YdcC
VSKAISRRSTRTWQRILSIHRHTICKHRPLTATWYVSRVRTLKVSTEMNAYLAPYWPCVAHIAHLTHTVTKAGSTTTEVVYLITTITPSKSSPERLLELNRRHWSIENRSHSVRDVSFKEDRSRLRSGNAPQILAAFRNLAITLIHRFGSSPFPQSDGILPPVLTTLLPSSLLPQMASNNSQTLVYNTNPFCCRNLNVKSHDGEQYWIDTLLIVRNE